MKNVFEEIVWSNHLEPLAGGVHVYACNIETLDMETMLPLLTQAERTKANAFRQLPDRQRFITGRLITKKLLGFYGSIDAAAITIFNDQNGRPTAHANTNTLLPLFNISHSGSIVLIAFSTQLVGIDVEKMSGVETESVAASIFSEKELYQYKNATDASTTFYCFWTRKEALLKAAGLGLIDDLKSVDISERADPDFVKTFTQKELALLSFRLHDHQKYFACLCYVKNIPTRFISLSNELLSQL